MPRMRLLFSRPDPAVRFLSRLRAAPPDLGSLLRSAARGAGFALGLFAALVALHVLLRDNVREVQPGRVYRAAQMKPERLAEFIDRRGIRTVVNLRGYCGDFDWYRGECTATHDAGISQEDVTLSAIRLPTPSEVRRLVEVLESSEPPLLLHCRQGVDRTGLAAVMVRLLEPGVTFEEAMRHLGLGYGHVPFNGTQAMRRFYALYRDWLAAMGQQHSPMLFRQWAMVEYCPGRCRARVHWLDFPEGDWPANRPIVVRVRARNTSIEPWPLKPGTNHGVHLRYRVSGATSFDGGAGQFDALVAPGEFIDLEIGVPPLPPGDYSLSAGLVDVDENAFSQFGVAPLVREFRVR